MYKNSMLHCKCYKPCFVILSNEVVFEAMIDVRVKLKVAGCQKHKEHCKLDEVTSHFYLGTRKCFIVNVLNIDRFCATTVSNAKEYK